MFWNLFSSERRVQEALDQSVGYDISPNILIHPSAKSRSGQIIQADLWKDYAVMPANSQASPPQRFEEPWERKKA
jgi:hypothetical protein